jgi:hypothetical protein
MAKYCCCKPVTLVTRWYSIIVLVLLHETTMVASAAGMYPLPVVGMEHRSSLASHPELNQL